MYISMVNLVVFVSFFLLLLMQWGLVFSRRGYDLAFQERRFEKRPIGKVIYAEYTNSLPLCKFFINWNNAQKYATYSYLFNYFLLKLFEQSIYFITEYYS